MKLPKNIRSLELGNEASFGQWPTASSITSRGHKQQKFLARQGGKEST